MVTNMASLWQYLNLFFDGSRHFNTWRCFLQIPLHDTGLWDHLFVAPSPKQHFLTCYKTIVPFNSLYHLCCSEASQELEKQTITRDLTSPSGETISEVMTNLPSPFAGHVRMCKTRDICRQQLFFRNWPPLFHQQEHFHHLGIWAGMRSWKD